MHSTRSYPLENTRTEGECPFYLYACYELKELIVGSGREEDIKPEDLLKLKVTMCCKPKEGKDQEEWALKDITSPPKDKDNRLQPCGGNCFANDNNRYFLNLVMDCYGPNVD